MITLSDKLKKELLDVLDKLDTELEDKWNGGFIPSDLAMEINEYSMWCDNMKKRISDG